jgi:hypothetical protein
MAPTHTASAGSTNHVADSSGGGEVRRSYVVRDSCIQPEQPLFWLVRVRRRWDNDDDEATMTLDKP